MFIWPVHLYFLFAFLFTPYLDFKSNYRVLMIHSTSWNFILVHMLGNRPLLVFHICIYHLNIFISYNFTYVSRTYIPQVLAQSHFKITSTPIVLESIPPWSLCSHAMIQVFVSIQFHSHWLYPPNMLSQLPYLHYDVVWSCLAIQLS